MLRYCIGVSGERGSVSGRFSRAGLVRRGAAAGAAAVVSGTIWGTLARAAAATTLPDADLSYLRLLIAAELLEADFQAQALRSGKLDQRGSSLLRQMAADEKAHYKGLSNLMVAAGQTPATSDD